MGTHAVEHVAKLLDIGLAGSIVDSGSTFCQDCSHNDIGRSRHRSLVKQHVGAFQPARTDLVDVALFDMAELRA